MNKRLVQFVALALLLIYAAAPATAQSDPFPVTVVHKYGTTEIPAEPQRVVAIGYTEQDALLAVDVTPIAVRYWYGDETNAIFPWAEDRVEGDNPIVLNMPFGNLNYEAILALEPDLISAVTAGITQEEYELLSQIAPTVAHPDGYIDFGVPWQVAAQLIGDAVGKSDEAAAAVEEVEGLFADVRAQNPQFADKTVAVAYSFGGAYGFYTDQDTRARFFTDLGFVVPDELVEIAGGNFYAEVSTERMDLLDQDLIVMVSLQFVEGGREALEADPLWSQLEAVQDGRVVYFDLDAENALGFSSPLSLPFALDAALRQLQAMFQADAAASAECEPGFRLFDNELLATDAVCIPEDPQRIVAQDLAALEMMYVLGIEPVATPNELVTALFPTLPAPYNTELVSYYAQFPDFGGFTINVEALLEVQPDIILLNLFYAPAEDGFIEQLSQIAPVVAVDSLFWKDIMPVFGAALNVEAEAQMLLDGYEARVETFREITQGRYEGASVALVMYGLDGALNMNLPGGISWVALDDLGFVVPPALPNTSEEVLKTFGSPYPMLSLEELSLLEADYLIMMSGSYTPEQAAAIETEFDELAENPLWSSLSAFQNDHVYFTGPHWLANGVLEAHIVLDEAFAYFVSVEPADVSPNPFVPETP
jgi:iron complex transport system substrate-binding protein